MYFIQSFLASMFQEEQPPSSVWRSYYKNTVVVNYVTVTQHRDTINYNFILVIRTLPWRWPKYCPKHFGENIAKTQYIINIRVHFFGNLYRVSDSLTNPVFL